MAPKSIFRQPGAKHFQLVHRSQRDPLSLDPEASQHVLKEFERENAKKGKSLAELEHSVPAADRARDNIGEAALYGIYYDDTEYDYMQHLREAGAREEGFDTILLEAPQRATRRKTNAELLLIPEEALPSERELPRDFAAGDSVPAELSGLQPDMDPHLRQTLEALDDDAFVDDEADDDFFGALVQDGERSEGDEQFEFRDDGIEDGENGEDEENPTDDSFEARFARFKKAQTGETAGSEDGDSEGADTVGRLPALPVIGGKRRRKGTSDTSGYSLSSSAMFRNEGLTNLDEHYDQVEKEYESEEDETPDDSDSDEAPDLIAARADFDALVDDFLDNYELVGNKVRPVMPGETPLDKLDTLRRALDAPTLPMNPSEPRVVVDDDELDSPIKDRWDCETILSTYSNLENHPRLISARTARGTAKIRLDRKTGLPSIIELDSSRDDTITMPTSASRDQLREIPRTTQTVSRRRGESPESKRARKQAVKEERQSRRAEKKATREQFATEGRRRVQELNAKDVHKIKLQ